MASPVAALVLSLVAAAALVAPAAAYTSIAESPYPAAAYPSIAESPYPSAANTSIAEAPFSSSPAPAPAPASEQTVFTIAPFDEQATDSRYLTAHMSSAAHKVEVFLAEEVESKLNDPATTNSDKECLEVCKEVYEGAAEAMKSGVESVSAGDFVKANFDISAFTIDIETCSDCSRGGFEKFDEWARGVAGDCLDRIAKYSNRI